MKASPHTLFLLAALLGNASAPSAPSRGTPFEVTVVDYQRCYILQGDLLFSPSDFQRLIARELSARLPSGRSDFQTFIAQEMATRRRILVHRSRNVRPACMSEAVRSLRRAGFSDVRLTPAKSR